jgi:DNA-directed RNA polymerase
VPADAAILQPPEVADNMNPLVVSSWKHERELILRQAQDERKKEARDERV